MSNALDTLDAQDNKLSAQDNESSAQDNESSAKLYYVELSR